VKNFFRPPQTRSQVSAYDMPTYMYCRPTCIKYARTFLEYKAKSAHRRTIVHV